MRRRHPLPKIWLMTDPRLGDLRAVVRRLPKGSGIIFRHYELPPRQRRALFKQVQQLAKAARHVLILADTPVRAWQWGADGAHNRSLKPNLGLRTVAVHNARGAILARRIKAHLMFVSPVFATASHPNASSLGRVRFGIITRNSRNRTIALGGINATRAKSLSSHKIYGWAGIDAFRI